MKISFIITLALTSLLPGLLSGQGVVTGKVTDEMTSEPLAGVYVIFGKEKGTVTGAEGEYSFDALSDRITVTFRFVGYKDVTHNLIVPEGNTIVLNVALQMQINEIGQIVVSASRTEQKIAELTVSMNLIKPADFYVSHITDAKELINKTPGIEVLDGQASIRGGTGFSYGVGSRVLALIDGLPILSPDAGSIKWQFLPLENISQIEIIKGASSVLYGSSALNGIINFRTAPASVKPETRFFVESGVYGRPQNEDWIWWESPRVFSTISFSHLRKAGKNDIALGINVSDNNGYRKFNDETLGRLSLRLKHYNEKINGLEYGVNMNSGYTDKTDFVLWENAATGALIQDSSSVASLNGRFVAVDPFISYESGNGARHDLRLRLQSAVNTFPDRSMNNADALSIYGEYQFNLSIREYLSIVAGFAGSSSRINSSFYGNHDGLNLAGFAQAEGTISERLKLVAGFRLEHNSLDGINERTVPIFRTGVNWQLAEYTYLRGSYGQGNRYPSIAEKYASTTLGAVRIVPNPGIMPETGWSSEIGIKQGLMLGGMTGQADLALFLSQNKDLIEYIFGYYPDPITGAYDFGFQATNVEQSRITGGEIEFILHAITGAVKTDFSGGYTFIHPVEINPVTNKSTGKFLKYRRKHSLKLGAGARYKKFYTGLNLYYRSSIKEIDEVFTGELTRESILPGFYDYWIKNNKGYFLLDSNIGYQVSDRYTLSIAVKNVNNAEYMGRPGDIQPHRNFSLRFEGKF